MINISQITFFDIIKSKGIINTEYSSLPTEYISTENELINYISKINSYNCEILWIRNGNYLNTHITDLDIISNNLHLINTPKILITTDGDRNVPSDYNINTVEKILESEKILFWYTQNYDQSIKHYKLKYYPIGFDFHSPHMLINDKSDIKFKYITNIRKIKIKKIKKKIFCDSHLRITHSERNYMFHQLKYNKHIDFLSQNCDFQNITNLYNRYKFILSPRGAGLDCHRTWELFLAGCIIITKSSSLDYMYINNKLPVVIINDWNELNIDLLEKLKVWYKYYNNYTKKENILKKLKYTYWLDNSNNITIKNNLIPDNIICTWKDNNLPKIILDNLRNLNNDKQLLFYTDNDIKKFFIEYYDNNYLNFFNDIKFGKYKSCFFKYCYLYKFGGYYVDIDVEFYYPISYFIQHNTNFFTIKAFPKITENNILQSLLFTAPNNPIIKMCIDDMFKYGSNISIDSSDVNSFIEQLNICMYNNIKTITNFEPNNINNSKKINIDNNELNIQLGQENLINSKYHIIYNEKIIAKSKYDNYISGEGFI